MTKFWELFRSSVVLQFSLAILTQRRSVHCISWVVRCRWS